MITVELRLSGLFGYRSSYFLWLHFFFFFMNINSVKIRISGLISFQKKKEKKKRKKTLKSVKWDAFPLEFVWNSLSLFRWSTLCEILTKSCFHLSLLRDVLRSIDLFNVWVSLLFRLSIIQTFSPGRKEYNIWVILIFPLFLRGAFSPKTPEGNKESFKYTNLLFLRSEQPTC